MGPTAVLVEDLVADPAEWSCAVRSCELPGVIDIVPAARTVLIRCTDTESLSRACARLPPDSAHPAPSPGGAGEIVIPVSYDGVDLCAVAAATELDVDTVIDLHAGAHFVVAFCGFAPGFAYLRGLPPDLHLPRRDTPRSRVAAGSVAIAAEYSAVYPRASPGGWHLLGSTDVRMFDPERSPPALLSPGLRVRFVPR